MATLFVSSMGFSRPSAHPAPPGPLAVETLKQLFPIRDLQDDVLETFALNRTPESIPRGTILFRRGQSVDSIVYLLSGTVEIKPRNGQSYRIVSGTTRANFPLESGDIHTSAAITATDVEILRVCPSIMSRYTSRQDVTDVALDRNDPGIPAGVRSSRLFQAFSHQFGDGSDLETLPLPGVSARINQAIAQGSGNAELGRILAWDPVLSAKLIHLGNSPLYLARGEILSCGAAISAIGREATLRLLVNSCSRKPRQIKNPWVRQALTRFWKKSVFRAAVCQVLATEAGLDPNVAQLAGLVADIGELPFITFADTIPSSYWTADDVEGALPYIRTIIGSVMLKKWNFPQELTDVPALARNWFAHSQPKLTVNDIVALANLLVTIGTPEQADLPPIQVVPAWHKFGRGRLTPEYALDVLHKAKAKLASRGMDHFDPVDADR